MTFGLVLLLVSSAALLFGMTIVSKMAQGLLTLTREMVETANSVTGLGEHQLALIEAQKEIVHSLGLLPPAEPLSSAPRDGTEIFLLTTSRVNGGVLISIHNGHWDGQGFVIGDRDSNTRCGDASATYWFPKELLEPVLEYVEPTVSDPSHGLPRSH